MQILEENTGNSISQKWKTIRLITRNHGGDWQLIITTGFTRINQKENKKYNSIPTERTAKSTLHWGIISTLQTGKDPVNRIQHMQVYGLGPLLLLKYHSVQQSPLSGVPKGKLEKKTKKYLFIKSICTIIFLTYK